MIIFSFDKKVGNHIDKYNSNFILSRIIQTTEPSQVGCMHLEAKGVVGYHQAAMPQLFLVVQGEGWASGSNVNKVFVSAGSAVFWDKGEWREAGTDQGMMVIVIEAESLNPVSFMPIQQK